jgi:hypothetical protein
LVSFAFALLSFFLDLHLFLDRRLLKGKGSRFRLLLKFLGVFHDLRWKDGEISLSALILESVANVYTEGTAAIEEGVGTWPLERAYNYDSIVDFLSRFNRVEVVSGITHKSDYPGSLSCSLGRASNLDLSIKSKRLKPLFIRVLSLNLLLHNLWIGIFREVLGISMAYTTI